MATGAVDLSGKEVLKPLKRGRVVDEWSALDCADIVGGRVSICRVQQDFRL
jgi:hypothetical protein